MTSSPIRQNIVPFQSPNGFHRSSDPASTLTESVAECFEHENGCGQIVIKRLRTVDNQKFWQVERWLERDGTFRRKTSFAERSRSEVYERICEKTNYIRQ